MEAHVLASEEQIETANAKELLEVRMEDCFNSQRKDQFAQMKGLESSQKPFSRMKVRTKTIQKSCCK